MNLEPGIYEGIPMEEYHQIPAVNASALKILTNPDLTPAHVWEEREPTSALSLGTDLHSATLEPAEWEAGVVIYEGGDRRGKAWTEFQAQHPGKAIHKPNEIEAILKMRKNIWAHPEAAAILTGSKKEVTFIWLDEETGLWCKARPDILNVELGIIGDIKTCQSACSRRFGYSIADYGYHIQAPHYLEGAAKVGLEVNSFVFFAQESKAPYFNQLFQLSAADMALGEKCRIKGMMKYLECQTANHWPGYPTGVTTIQLP